jgi:alanyl-tRNA synthetase
VRRVDALVGDSAYGYQAREHVLVSQLSELLKTRGEDLPERVGSLVARLRDAERELAALRQANLLAGAGAVADAATDVGGVRLAAFDAGQIASADDVRALALDVRNRLGDSEAAVAAVGGTLGERAVIVVAANAAARERGIRAGALAKAASQALGGGGGGKDDVAQGGGQRPEAMGAAFAAVKGGIAG